MPPVSAARSTTTLPGCMRLDHRAGDQQRRGTPRHRRRGDEHVGGRDERREQVALALRRGRRSSRGRSRRSPPAPRGRARRTWRPSSAPRRPRRPGRRTPPRPRRAAWPSRSPAARRRRRRARAPWPAGSCPAAVISSGKKDGSRSAATSAARYPDTSACDVSASIDCAREMRGSSSSANAVVPAAASAADAVGVGRRRRGTRRSRTRAAAVRPGRASAARRAARRRRRPSGAAAATVAPAAVRGVGDLRVPAGTRLHHDVEAGLGQPRRRCPAPPRRAAHPGASRRDEDSHGGHGSELPRTCVRVPTSGGCRDRSDTHTSAWGTSAGCQTARPWARCRPPPCWRPGSSRAA